MNEEFRRTKAGIKICPFFGWQSENIEGLGRQEENDVSISICSHEQNSRHYEGNCQKEWCPINRTCKWTVDEDGIFDTGCGNRFEFISDGPEENHFAYCPYCGGKLAVYDGHS